MAKKNNPVQEVQEYEMEPDDIDESEENYPEIPDRSSYFDTPFTKEQLQNAHLLRNTPYKDEVLQLLETTTLSPSAKRAIKTFAEQFLSERTILANIKNIESVMITFDLAEVKMKTNYWPSDLKKPILFHIINLIRDHYTTILTNATGESRERILNGRQSMESRMINQNEPPIREQAEKRTGILGGIR